MKYQELNEGRTFRSSDEMVRYMLKELKESLQFAQKEDDFYYLAQDVADVIETIESSRVNPKFRS